MAAALSHAHMADGSASRGDRMNEPRAKILLVDDNASQRLALRAILADLEVTPVEAPSGREALRCLLKEEFAVILLDVNMPGLDGFETASLIRARRSSEHTPIIFITAFGDDTYAARGYSLGAVDYILAPVQPEILRTKVSVFIELFNKTEQVRRQREVLHRYATQLQQLSQASLAINSAYSVEAVLRVVADNATRIIGVRQAAATAASPSLTVTRVADGNGADGAVEVSSSPRHALAIGLPHSQRLTAAELERQSGAAAPPELIANLPMRGLLAAPLTAHDGSALGVIQLSHKVDGEFTAEDEGILVQLAQMASIAIENTVAAEAREANRLKDEFLGVLSHELRTPLQALLTWSGILRRQPVEPELLKRGLEVIERSAKTQTQLIADLLDVSRIIRGQLRLDSGPVDLASVTELAIEALRAEAAAKRVAIVWTPPMGGCGTVGDAMRLQQVVWNLLSNAIKFTPSGGRVELQLSASGNRVVLQVRDTGCGIAPDFLPHLFERFRQADSSASRQHGGLGLGLAIVRHLVDLHGGTVVAANATDGPGAVLTVSLPRQDSSPVAAAAAGPELVVPPLHGPRLDGIRVILVEDERDARESLTTALELLGARVFPAGSAADAIQLLESESADVLLSDIGMPDEDGYALIRKVRAREAQQGGRLPAAALTAYARAEDRTAAQHAGFDMHVHKPVEPLELAQVVRRLAGRA